VRPGSGGGSGLARAAPRIAARSATILFHHPWNDEGTPDLDAAASAVAGAYLGSLGLSESAIFFMTEKGKDEGNPLNDETAQAYGIETVFIGEAAPLNRAIATEKLVHGALVLVCRLDRRAPYASGESCVAATAESSTAADVPRFIVARGCRVTGMNLARPLIASTASRSIAA
jgi:hypothetical protein